MPRETEFGRLGQKDFANGDMCELCEEYPRQLVGGCKEVGCHRFKSSIKKFSGGKIQYRMDCPRCKEWKLVLKGHGFHCSKCGLGCHYASSISYKDTVAGKKISRAIEGPLYHDEESED